MLKILQDSSLRSALVLAATLGASLSAQAASVTFDLATYQYDDNNVGIDGPEGHATWPITSGGLTLVINSPDTIDGKFHDDVNPGYGIRMGNNSLTASGFGMLFSSDVNITGYTIISGGFSGQIGFIGTGLSIGDTSAGFHSLETPVGTASGQALALVGNGSGSFFLKSITVETSSVPDSNPWAFQAFALFGMVALGHRYGRRSQAA